MEDIEVREQWEERITAYRASGLTAARWCERTGHSIGQLKYWITKTGKAARKRDWAPVEIVDSNPAAASKITVHVGSARVEVEPGFDQSLLSEVLGVVSSTC
jgi:hypothetical protein